MIATDQPTDSQTDTPCYTVCNDKPHLHSSEMQPNNFFLFKHFVAHSKAELHTHKYTIQKIYYR